MSTAKRQRRRQEEARSASPLPGPKRLKTGPSTHVPQQSGLDFLVNEDARAGRKLEAKLTNGVQKSKANRVDESHALVAPNTRDEEDGGKVNGTAHEVIDISSGEEESSAYASSDDGQGGNVAAAQQPLTNGHVSESEEESEDEDAELGAEDDRMEDVLEAGEDAAAASPEEAHEPSFGELLQARYPRPIDVHASAPQPAPERTSIALAPTRTLTVPSATSLGTVLTQALRTNDKDMMESCLRVTDAASVKATLQRLPSNLAATLLQRLAERVHKAPGRTGTLMVWMQNTLIAHGGYMASQPEMMRRLKSLALVVRERASGLQPLLHLKGKLDMLAAQLEHRQNLHAASRAANAQDEDDEDAVVYVDGQDDDWSDDEQGLDVDVDMLDGAEMRALEAPSSVKSKGQTATPRSEIESADDESDDEDLPNGVAHEIDGSESEGDDDQVEEGLFDDQAEEISDDEGEDPDSEEEASNAPESNDESEHSDDESEPEMMQPPPKTLNRKR